MVSVRLECGPVGLSIEEAAAGITSVAKRLSLPVVCSFNGIDLHADSATAMRAVISQYQDGLRIEREHSACPAGSLA
jgi:hypothetical protein